MGVELRLGAEVPMNEHTGVDVMRQLCQRDDGRIEKGKRSTGFRGVSPLVGVRFTRGHIKPTVGVGRIDARHHHHY